MTTPTPGWYPDPIDGGQSRWWDGTGWTEATLAAVSVSASTPVPATTAAPIYTTPAVPLPSPPAEPPAIIDAPNRGSEHAVPFGGRGKQIGLALGLMLVVVATVAAALPLLSSTTDVDTPANDLVRQEAVSSEASSDPTATELQPTGPGDTTGTDSAEAATTPVEPDPDGFGSAMTPIRILVAGQVHQFELSNGRATLADGRGAQLVEELTTTGDLTGDGRDEDVLVFDIVSDGPTRTAIGVVGWSADGERTALDPPVLTASLPYSEAFEVDVGTIDRVSVRDGALEVGVTIPPGIEGAPPQRPEISLTWTGSVWNATADGPLTRAARSHAQTFYGLRFDDLACDGRTDVRGQHPWCAGQPAGEPHDRLFVTLLLVDDDGGFRSSIGRDGPISRAEEVRASLGTGELFCRDIALEASQAIGADWEIPMAAVSYWFDEGMPARMDASGNGIPCQTVFEGIAEFLGGSDGRIEEGYTHRR